jgi:hypothetical protein
MSTNIRIRTLSLRWSKTGDLIIHRDQRWQLYAQFSPD